jgi:hypothetical protein
MKSLLDPAFRYVPAARTDLRKTFARIRRELAAGEGAERARSGAADNAKGGEVMNPCKHLDYRDGKYGPDITLETTDVMCADGTPVRFWKRGES